MKKRISCKKKVKHKTKEAAYAAKRNLEKQGFHARAYKCSKCGLYHVGKPSFHDNPKQFWDNIMNKDKNK